jgi:hypothetical protein
VPVPSYEHRVILGRWSSAGTIRGGLHVPKRKVEAARLCTWSSENEWGHPDEEPHAARSKSWGESSASGGPSSLSDNLRRQIGEDQAARHLPLVQARLIRELLLRHVCRRTAADFNALRSQPFIGTCPAAFDGTGRLYTFTTAAGPETLAGCRVEIDQTAQLVALVKRDRCPGLRTGGDLGVTLDVPRRSVGPLMTGQSEVCWARTQRLGHWPCDQWSQPPRRLL